MPVTSENPLQSYDDVARAFRGLWLPVREKLSANGAAVTFGPTLAHFGLRATALEGFARQLWGFVPYALQNDADHSDWRLMRDVLAEGTDTDNRAYWGTGGDLDHRFVEVGAITVALLLAQQQLWAPLSAVQKRNVQNWIATITSQKVRNNNWIFFRIFGNRLLEQLGDKTAVERYAADFKVIDSFYQGDGWYNDGESDHRDYYVAMAYHFYGLLWAGLFPNETERSDILRKRATAFAPAYAAWFASDGAALPIGRSLTYRFAHSAFWAALAFANVPALPWGRIKSIYLRNLRWWSKRPITSDGGFLTIGYAYENSLTAESYTSSASPYWALKAFLALSVPKTHPFWATPEEHSISLPVEPQPTARLCVCRDQSGDHVWALSNNEVPSWSMRHAAQKYGKFVYSSYFAFATPVGGTGPAHGAGDNTLLIGDGSLDWRDGENHWRCRTQPIRRQMSSTELYSRWRPWPNVWVETWLVPWGEGHVRCHFVVTGRHITEFEGGFAVDAVGHTTETESSGRGHALVDRACGFSTILDPFGERQGVVVHPEPNTHLLHPLVSLPGLVSRRRPGSFWLLSACVGTPNQKSAARDWLQRFNVVRSPHNLILRDDAGRSLDLSTRRTVSDRLGTLLLRYSARKGASLLRARPRRVRFSYPLAERTFSNVAAD